MPTICDYGITAKTKNIETIPVKGRLKQVLSAPDRDGYYGPGNSFLNEVLDRKVGAKITLSTL